MALGFVVLCTSFFSERLVLDSSVEIVHCEGVSPWIPDCLMERLYNPPQSSKQDNYRRHSARRTSKPKLFRDLICLAPQIPYTYSLDESAAPLAWLLVQSHLNESHQFSGVFSLPSDRFFALDGMGFWRCGLTNYPDIRVATGKALLRITYRQFTDWQISEAGTDWFADWRIAPERKPEQINS